MKATNQLINVNVLLKSVKLQKQVNGKCLPTIIEKKMHIYASYLNLVQDFN